MQAYLRDRMFSIGALAFSRHLGLWKRRGVGEKLKHGDETYARPENACTASYSIPINLTLICLRQVPGSSVLFKFDVKECYLIVDVFLIFCKTFSPQAEYLLGSRGQTAKFAAPRASRTKFTASNLQIRTSVVCDAWIELFKTGHRSLPQDFTNPKLRSNDNDEATSASLSFSWKKNMHSIQNQIHKLQGKKCSFVYYGKTEQQLKTRIAEPTL